MEPDNRTTVTSQIIYVAPNSHQMTETKRLWTMGNYSRFIRPEFVRVAAESTLQPKLKATAFQSADGARLVVVVINNSRDAFTVGLKGNAAAFSQTITYETSAEHNLAETFTGPSPETFTFSAKSVTTLVYQQ
jgi:O-glycosyl hydrolase